MKGLTTFPVHASRLLAPGLPLVGRRAAIRAPMVSVVSMRVVRTTTLIGASARTLPRKFRIACEGGWECVPRPSGTTLFID